MNKFTDTTKHQGQRKKLVKTLIRKGINSKDVINAINKIPRHFFMDSAFKSYSYEDKAYPISSDQTISQPFTVAFQTQLLELVNTDKVLEIGTGSGYQSAILSILVSKVFTIERQHKLFKQAKKLFEDLNYKIKETIFGDGYLGYEKEAPFDAILVTAGAEEIPKPLMEQLKIGGRLVIPLGKEIQIMTRLTRISSKEFNKETFGEFRFVPLLKNKN
mgnify:CR=1 FL=1|tara:strand:+ start:105 stop:755 length:651 start_codon:yes stop_codon:yes gene_type:complete